MPRVAYEVKTQVLTGLTEADLTSILGNIDAHQTGTGVSR